MLRLQRSQTRRAKLALTLIARLSVSDARLVADDRLLTEVTCRTQSTVQVVLHGHSICPALDIARKPKRARPLEGS